MKKTFVDVMLELPVDATLREFLTTHSLPVPDGFAWDDTPETSQFLVEAVKVWHDIAARDRMTANLMASVQLGDAAGKQAMFEAAVADGAALAGLALCASDIHRSFWLYVHHPALFERAYDFSFWEQHGQQTQQYDLGLKRQPNGSDANLAALRHAISAFYKRELQCGDGSVALVLDPLELIQDALQADRPAPGPALPGEAGWRILVVEDSVTSRVLLQTILEEAGHQVETAVDGIDAFARLKQHEFDMVVSDVDMPRMNGFTLTEKIRAEGRQFAGLRVALVTSLDSPEDRERGRAVGADAYVVKSNFNTEDFLETVRRLMRRRYGEVR